MKKTYNIPLSKLCVTIVKMLFNKFDCVVVFEGNRGLGKCQVRGSKVLMKDGTWKHIENINVGDEVISPQKDGTFVVAPVKEIHSRFEENIYEIREASRDKRLLYKCAFNHEIPVWKSEWKRIKGNWKKREKSPRKLMNLTAEELSKRFTKDSHYCTFTSPKVDFGNKNPEIDAYSLGCFLGDGHFQNDLGITTKKNEIIFAIKNAYPYDFLKAYSKKDNLASTYRFSIRGIFAKQLDKIGLRHVNSGTKFIPKECIYAPIEYRLNLLAGMIDTDGYIMKSSDNCISITTKSNQMAEDIKNLVFSLGGYSRIRKIKKRCQNNFIGEYNHVSISFSNPKILPLRTFKKDRLGGIFTHNPTNVGIKSIKAEKGEMVYGFSIDSESHWYVTDNWFVTHNSTCAWHIARKVRQYINIIIKETGGLNSPYRNYYNFKPVLQLSNPAKFRFIEYKREGILNFFDNWHSTCIADEMVTSAFNRDFWNEDQKNLIKILNMYRDHCNLFLMCVPQFQILDNQIKNLTKIRITVLRRGLCAVQTPNSIIYSRDKWDSATNEKIEREWLVKKKNPNYTRLTTFRGYMKFPALSEKEQKVYDAIKNYERNVMKSDIGIDTGNKEAPKNYVDDIVDKLLGNSVRNMEYLRGIAESNGITLDAFRGRITKKLRQMKKDHRLSSYFTDKKAKQETIEGENKMQEKELLSTINTLIN